MKKICLIPSFMLPIPNVKGGAIETLITNLIDENETKKKFYFTIVCMYDKKAKEISKKYKYTKFIFLKRDIIDFVRRALRKILNCKPIPYLTYKACWKIRKEKFDYIIVEGGMYESFKILLKKYRKNQLIAHIHHHMLANKNIDDIYGNIIAISEFVKKEWIRTSDNKETNRIKLLLNSIDQKKFDKDITDEEKNLIRSKYNISKNDFVVMFCGRIIEVKGLHKLIEAVKQINQNDIKLLIIGSPNFAIKSKSKYLQEIKQSIKGQEDKIKFSGYIDNEQLYKYYKCSDVLVVPSLWEEAAGLVCIEGMLTKTPLIVSNSGGMIEYVNSDCAIIVNRDKEMVKNLAKAILKLKNNKDLYNSMKVKGYKRAQKFTKNIYYDNFNKLIDQINNESEREDEMHEKENSST